MKERTQNSPIAPLPLVEQKPLSQYTSWRIGGTARWYVEIFSVEKLQSIVQWAQEQNIPTLLLGGGTNILIRDEGFHGLVIRYVARTWHIEETDDGTALLTVETGMPIGRLAWSVGEQGWKSLQWAAGLPGSVGGAIYGNAGCYGGDIAGVFRSAKMLVHNEIQTWNSEQMGFGYRTSGLKQNRNQAKTIQDAAIILSSEFALVRGEPSEIKQRMQQIAAERKKKTPIGHSCGSVFKNPATSPHPAGMLIDQAGLKGTRIGGAEISPLHANYIVNLGNATSDDVLRLIDLAQTRVLQTFGVELELEIQVVG